MLLEIINDLAAVVDCGLDEVLPGADDDFLLGGHGVFLSGWFLVWECSPVWTCLQVLRPDLAFYGSRLWRVRVMACYYGVACRGR